MDKGVVVVSGAFQLEVGEDRLAVLTFDLAARKVNLFTRDALVELERVITELAARRDLDGLVLFSAKADTFVAGADIDEIAEVTDPAEAEAGSRLGQRVFAAWERLPFPTIAAIRGTCLGGGTELALASTYRVVSDRPAVRIGLPEVRLGILPGWGGSTRLPRTIGVAAALDLILTGKTIDGRKALALGFADALLPDPQFARLTRRFALERRGTTDRAAPAPLDLKTLLLEKNPLGRRILFDQVRAKALAASGGRYPAPLRAIEVVRAGVENGREVGFDSEALAVSELAVSPVAKNLIHVFRLQEASRRNGTGTAGREPRQVAVVGAGVMGGGIAQLVAEKARVPVRLKDLGLAPLATGMGHAAAIFAKRRRRGRLRAHELRERMALLRPTLDDSGMRRCDLVIEAVVEKLSVKQEVFAELASVAPPGAILASNTSSLSIAEIGAKVEDRGRVAGMHFFNPVDKMPLVEVVAGPETSPEAIATVVRFARRLGKTPVVVRDTPGFLVNRILMVYLTEALWLLSEGHRIEDLDRAMTDWGMPMGPMTVTDEVGLDVAVKVSHILTAAFGERLPIPGGLDRLVAAGRLGAKVGSGLYHYADGRRQGADPEVYGLLGFQPTVAHPDLAALAERMVLPMVDEAARCLAEGVVGSPGELDLAMIMGTGFPPFRGGLCRWADQQGPRDLRTAMERLGDTVGPRFLPGEAFDEVVERGGFYRSGGGTTTSA